MILALIIAVIFIAGVLSVIAVKKGWLSDRDGDGIADIIEDTVEDVVEDVKEKAEDVVEDVKEAVKKKTRRGRKPASSKSTGGRAKKTGGSYYDKSK